MTIAVANTTNTHSWQYALDRLNDLATAMSNKVVTVNSNTASGNAVVNGTFQANIGKFDTLQANGDTITISSNVYYSGTNATFSVGNSTVNAVMNSTYLSIASMLHGNSTVNVFSNSTTVSISNNLVLNSTGMRLGNTTANLVINSSSISINGQEIVDLDNVINVNVPSSTTLVDSFLIDTYRGVEYSMSIKNLDANGYQMSKVHVLQDGGGALIAEFGVLYSNNQLGVFTANANSTHGRVYLTLGSGVSNVQVKASRTPLPV